MPRYGAGSALREVEMGVESIPGVAVVQVVRGADHDAATPPRLLVEVPHGADQRAHYDACRSRLTGDFPDHLEDFFHANTDEGAWDLGVAAAERFVARRSTEAAVLVRCLVPRTFIDCNRVLDIDPADHGGGVTAGLPVYVTHPPDIGTLYALHQAYCTLVDQACAEVVAADGLVLVPHTYAPRTVGIAEVGHDIVEQMHRVWAPGVAETWPLRSEVDVITADANGHRQCPEGAVERLLAGFGALGVEAVENGTYWLHPASRAAELSDRHPRRLLCLEVRRDLVMRNWTPFVECEADPERVAAFGALLGETMAALVP